MGLCVHHTLGIRHKSINYFNEEFMQNYRPSKLSITQIDNHL